MQKTIFSSRKKSRNGFRNPIIADLNFLGSVDICTPSRHSIMEITKLSFSSFPPGGIFNVRDVFHVFFLLNKVFAVSNCSRKTRGKLVQTIIALINFENLCVSLVDRTRSPISCLIHFQEHKHLNQQMYSHKLGIWHKPGTNTGT